MDARRNEQAGRSTGTPPPASEPAQTSNQQRQLQRHYHRTTLREAIATQRAAAGLLGEVVEERRRTCGATRELARLAAIARELWCALADLEARGIA
jgi:hypothetical protein